MAIAALAATSLLYSMALTACKRVQTRYAFFSIKPVAYSGRPPHVYFKVKLESCELLTTQTSSAGKTSNGRNFLTRGLSDKQRASLEVAFKTENDALAAQFTVVVST